VPEELPRTTARLLISSAQVATSMADVLSGRSTGASRNAEGGAVRAILFDWQRYQMLVRALARKHDVYRRMVRQAIASPVPPDRKVPERAAGPGGGGRVDR